MSLQTRLADFAVAVGTDIKQLRTWLTGSSSGDLTALTTTNKSSIVGAINEVKAGNSGAPPVGTTTVQGVVELATLAEMATGTDTTRVATVEGVRQERTALKNELLGGASAAWDTLQELSVAIQNAEETGAIDALTTVVGTKQDSSAIGNTDADLVAAYATAKA